MVEFIRDDACAVFNWRADGDGGEQDGDHFVSAIATDAASGETTNADLSNEVSTHAPTDATTTAPASAGADPKAYRAHYPFPITLGCYVSIEEEFRDPITAASEPVFKDILNVLNVRVPAGVQERRKLLGQVETRSALRGIAHCSRLTAHASPVTHHPSPVMRRSRRSRDN